MRTRRAFLAGAALAATIVIQFGAPARADAPTTTTGEMQIFAAIPVKPQEMDGFLAVMKENVRGSRKEPGNVSFDAFQSEAGGDAIYLFERWKDRAAFETHMTLPHLKAVVAKAGTAAAGAPTERFLTETAPLRGAAPKPVANPGSSRNVAVVPHVKPQERETFLKAFAEVMPQARAAPGNLAFDLHEDMRARNVFVLFERWTDVASHEAHLGQDYSKKLDGIVPATLSRPAMEGRVLLKEISVADS
ncbi:putative quinol monooxygenase [Chenggangzhangella methanolivorans]|uniref:Antibiotic biosynthesis monooxygenase n=1 Tax=Chenggangzhangella methanolivorans TaxID=1437009 RepID=A0A9E6R5I7_9HYPH|nr:putative quinol monooxygenase [Chenggangzhangella methanolivorans]QZN98258.1 antibiotic biosynthesis monooxygenase [Chenggangzhangella methanolivorans]